MSESSKSQKGLQKQLESSQLIVQKLEYDIQEQRRQISQYESQSADLTTQITHCMQAIEEYERDIEKLRKENAEIRETAKKGMMVGLFM